MELREVREGGHVEGTEMKLFLSSVLLKKVKGREVKGERMWGKGMRMDNGEEEWVCFVEGSR